MSGSGTTLTSFFRSGVSTVLVLALVMKVGFLLCCSIMLLAATSVAALKPLCGALSGPVGAFMPHGPLRPALGSYALLSSALGLSSLPSSWPVLVLPGYLSSLATLSCAVLEFPHCPVSCGVAVSIVGASLLGGPYYQLAY